MFYYQIKNKILFSFDEYPHFNKVTEEYAAKEEGMIYFLNNKNPLYSRKAFSVSHTHLLYLKKEGIHLLQQQKMENDNIPHWIIHKIQRREVTSVNTQYHNWTDMLDYSFPQKWRVNIAGLGDVGGTLLLGLRLLGGEVISKIGIYDRNQNKLMRWIYEGNQIYSPGNLSYPEIYPLEKDELFECDLFVFCIASRVPAVGEEVKDVRLIQLEENAKIISTYAKQARERKFKGTFAVLSDPVDLLCKVVWKQSNTDQTGKWDLQGLAPEQIRGYGLGVMNARALYYAKKNPETTHYENEGRAFGPHGEDLVIADSIENYNDELSLYLTEKAKKANIEVRKTGFKPYIAPALSSGSLSLIATMKGKWHYSSTFMGGVYMGAKNRLNPSGTEIEVLDLHPKLMERLQQTFKRLETIP